MSAEKNVFSGEQMATHLMSTGQKVVHGRDYIIFVRGRDYIIFVRM